MSGGPLRDFVRRNCTQSWKARRFCQDAHDLREAPSQKLRAPVLQASESSLRLRELLQQGNEPKGQQKGTQWTGIFGLGLRGSLESYLRLPGLVQRGNWVRTMKLPYVHLTPTPKFEQPAAAAHGL